METLHYPPCLNSKVSEESVMVLNISWKEFIDYQNKTNDNGICLDRVLTLYVIKDTSYVVCCVA